MGNTDSSNPAMPDGKTADPFEDSAVLPQDEAAFDDDAGTAGERERAPDVPKPNLSKAVNAVLRSLDRVLSLVLRCDRTPEHELTEYAASIVPAVEWRGDRLGPFFWTIVAAVSFAGFVIGKIWTARASETYRKPPEERGEVEVSGRRLGGEPKMPKER